MLPNWVSRMHPPLIGLPENQRLSRNSFHFLA
jgi:hypothetical protein